VSKPKHGVDAAIDDLIQQTKEMAETAADEAHQLDMLDPVTPEEMVAAREALGPEAGRIAVLREARASRGRPPGSRNKRTDDFVRYLSQFGPDPAVTMMIIQATPPEVLIEQSQQQKVHSFRKDGTENVVIERLSYSEAQSIRLRAAEGLLPYFHSKKPVAIDATIRGIRVVEEIGAVGSAEKAIEAEFTRIARSDEIDAEPEA
jgi:hypothetical protein